MQFIITNVIKDQVHYVFPGKNNKNCLLEDYKDFERRKQKQYVKNNEGTDTVFHPPLS